MKKLIRAALLALLGSLLSAFYLSMVQAADIALNETKLPGTPSWMKSAI